MSEPDVSSSPARPGALRVLVATLVSVGFIAGSLAYHDGVFGTDGLAQASEEGVYRFKGRVTALEPDGQGFALFDGSGTRMLQWNVTSPRLGSVVVVDAEATSNGTLRALAVSTALVFRGV